MFLSAIFMLGFSEGLKKIEQLIFLQFLKLHELESSLFLNKNKFFFHSTVLANMFRLQINRRPSVPVDLKF